MNSADNIETKTRKLTTSLRVQRPKGEKALKLLTATRLIDPKLRINPDGSHLVFPLARLPSRAEAETLEEELGPLNLGSGQFEPKTRNNMSLEEALGENLPPHVLASLPGSFDIIGDIAVVEFAPELVDFEKIVAAGVLRVHKNVRAVFGKAGAVSGKERVRPLRHLAGEDRTTTTHKEFGCMFKVDLGKAYFSPRLSSEHRRISEMVEPGEHVVDLFAGVGPFTVMVVKRLADVEVDAVDMNPEAVRLVEENLHLNKPKGIVRVWQGDARQVVERNLAGKASRVIMNHPSEAGNYLDVACNALRREGGVLHFYTFAEGLDHKEKAVRQVADGIEQFGWRIADSPSAHALRGVSPMNWQVVVDARIVPA